MYPQLNKFRERICLSGIWNFVADNEGIEKGFANGLPVPDMMGVPGSWNEQNTKYLEFHGKGFYERELFIPDSFSGKRVFLRFGAVSGKATVFVDGERVGYHEGGFLPFECDISALSAGKHRLVVCVDNSLDPWSLPPAKLLDSDGRMGFCDQYPATSYDFFPFGGIHRDVFLCATPSVYIKDITVRTKISGEVSFDVVLSDSVVGKITVESDGEVCELTLNGEDAASGRINIKNPRLWRVGDGQLYDLRASLITEGDCDEYTVSYGIREVRVEENKFLLNGESVHFKGFGKHEDFHVIGKGFSAPLWVKDFSLLKWIGANSFRTSHYPYDENILDMADREGIMVIGEAPLVGLNPRFYNDEHQPRVNAVIKEMISRDKNHPSIVMWSLANEPGKASEGDAFFASMAKTAREADPTRPITYAAHQSIADNSSVKYFDVMSVTRYPAWYYIYGRIDEGCKWLSEDMDEFYNTYKKPYLIAEFGADTMPGLHSEPAQMFSEEYQSELLSSVISVLRSKPYVIGEHVWAFADFKANQNYSRVFYNRKGVFTRERDPKMAAHTLRKIWTEN